MTQNTSNDELEISEKLLALDWDMQPERDLWPDISSNIKFSQRNTKPARSWMPVAMAACLTLAVVSVVFSFGTYRQSQQNEQMQATLMQFQQSQIQLIEQQHQVVRTQFSMMLLQERDQLDPVFVAELQSMMDTIDQASMELKVAMKAQPNNPNLASMLVKTYQNETKLLNKIQHKQNLSI